MKFSVIIPNYNGEKNLKDCLNSITAQNYKDYEIIVVDDASTDSSCKIVKKYKQVKLIKYKKNKGPASARNKGADYAKGDILLFLDSDVSLPKNCLNLINQRFSKQKNISVIVGLPKHSKKNNNLYTDYFLSRIYHNYSMLSDKIDIIYSTMFAIRKTVFFDVGKFNEKFKSAGIEDTELGNRLYNKGYVIKLLKDSGIIHCKKHSFRSLMKNDFLRTRKRIKFVLRGNQIKNIFIKKRFISTPINQIYSSILIFPILLTLIIAFIKPFTSFFLLFLLFLFYFLNKSYINFMRKRHGMFLSIKIYMLLLIDMFIVNLGVFFGSLDYVFGEKY